MAYYSESVSVALIRLAGIHSETSATKRMIEAAAQQGVENPWTSQVEAWRHWCEWWEGTIKSRGQTPSEMFLWYLVTLHRNQLENLVSTTDQMKHLPISFRGSTEEALDIYCAQLRWTDENEGPIIFPTYNRGLQEEFNGFATWMRTILLKGLSGLSVDKYKQVALLTAAVIELKIEPEHVSDDAWDAFGEFIRTPRKAGSKWIKDGYPEQKGRWRGLKGQKTQCDRVIELVQAIVKKHP